MSYQPNNSVDKNYRNCMDQQLCSSDNLFILYIYIIITVITIKSELSDLFLAFGAVHRTVATAMARL